VPEAARAAGAAVADAAAREADSREVEVEVDAEGGDLPLPADACERAARAALAAAGVSDGHAAIAFVDPERMRQLNAAHRAIDRHTDVLSFPIDGAGPVAGPRELGDVIVCPDHTDDLEEAIVHGVLHLCGHDDETDGGEMLALQVEIMRSLRG